MAFSCVAYLCSSFSLTDYNIPESAKLARIVDSFYGFHLYANEHWLQHVIAFSQGKAGLGEAKQSELYTLIARLVQMHNDAQRTIKQCGTDPLPVSITTFQGFQDFLQQCNAFRKGIKRRLEETGEGKI